jgi:5'-nucleotidase/UDP-sugar diphosphatase
VQAHEWGKYLGRADFEYRNGEFKLLKYALIPINLKKSVTTADGQVSKVSYTDPIAQDKDMLALLAPFQQFGQDKLAQQIGSSDGKLEGDRAVVRGQITNLGVLIGRAMMARTKADLAMVNAGGVRDSIAAGAITYKDVLKVHPFGNTACTVDLTGAELQAYLNAAAKMSPGSGAFPQFAGVALEVVGGVATQVRVGNAALDANKIYKLAINNFQASGGDGYPKLSNHASFVNTGFVDADILRGFIAANSPLNVAKFDPAGTVLRR